MATIPERDGTASEWTRVEEEGTHLHTPEEQAAIDHAQAAAEAAASYATTARVHRDETQLIRVAATQELQTVHDDAVAQTGAIRDEASGYATTATEARDAAISARNLAVDARDTASGHATTATMASGTAVAARDATLGARDTALGYRDTALGYRDQSLTARDAAIAAQAAAEAAAEAAQQSSGGSPEWVDIQNKPATFTPSAHTHLWADITDKPTTFTPSAHTHLWADITDKPTTFTPSAHTHAMADLADLDPWHAAYVAIKLDKAGGTMTGKLNIKPMDANGVYLNIGSGGTLGVTPVSGDFWANGASLYIRIGSSTQEVARLSYAALWTAKQTMRGPTAGSPIAGFNTAPSATEPLAPSDGDHWLVSGASEAYKIRINGNSRTLWHNGNFNPATKITQADLSQIRAIWGLIPSNNAANPGIDIDISAGACRDDSNAYDIVFAASKTKRLNAAFVAGGAGMLDTGSMAANTGYHIFAIYNPTTLVADYLASTSYSNPVMPAGFTVRRCIGSVMTDAGNAIRGFVATEQGKELLIQYKTTVDTPGVVGAVVVQNAITTRTLPVPPGVKTRVKMQVQIGNDSGAATSHVIIRDPDLGGAPAFLQDWELERPAGSTIYGGWVEVMTSASGTVITGDNQATAYLTLRVKSYWHRRH